MKKGIRIVPDPGTMNQTGVFPNPWPRAKPGLFLFRWKSDERRSRNFRTKSIVKEGTSRNNPAPFGNFSRASEISRLIDEELSLPQRDYPGLYNPKSHPNLVPLWKNEELSALFALLFFSQPVAPSADNILDVQRLAFTAVKLFQSGTKLGAELLKTALTLLQQPQTGHDDGLFGFVHPGGHGLMDEGVEIGGHRYGHFLVPFFSFQFMRLPMIRQLSPFSEEGMFSMQMRGPRIDYKLK
jgi:hypothetical protein